MKYVKYLWFFILSLQASANDLIFKSGFENTVLISGHVTGLTSNDMIIALSHGDFNGIGILIDTNGQFSFTREVNIGDDWEARIVRLPFSPNRQSCVISNNSGIAVAVGFDDVQIVCNYTPWTWDEMNWNDGGWQ